MGRKEVKGIGGFLLIYITCYIIGMLFALIGIILFYDISINYMIWEKGSIRFLFSFDIFLLIINIIHIVMLIFVREKYVISFTINFYIFNIISSTLLPVIFNDIFFDYTYIKDVIISICMIMYFKKSIRVKNTYCGYKTIDNNEHKSNSSEDNDYENNKQYYYSNWKQFSNERETIFNNHQDSNYDDKYNRSNWKKYSQEHIHRNNQQSNANEKKNSSYHQSNNYEKKENNGSDESYENTPPNDVIKAFNVFDMPITSSFESIKKKYHLLIKIYHPDKNNGDGETSRYAAQKTKEINMAYSILKTYLTQMR